MRAPLVLPAVSVARHLRRARSLRQWLGNAFAVSTPAQTLNPEDERLLERMAEAVVRRGLARPTILFLESAGPMNFLGSQVLHALAPVLSLACNTRELEQAAHLLERRDALPRLAALIEAKADSGQTPSR